MNIRFFFGFLLGGLIGAGTALLLAPGEGDETRHKVSDATQPARDRVVALAARFKVKFHDTAESIKQAI